MYFRSHLRYFVRMIHTYCLPVVLIDFFQAGILRDAKHFPPLAASILTLGPLGFAIRGPPVVKPRAAQCQHRSTNYDDA
jgi:hypothetical protein